MDIMYREICRKRKLRGEYVLCPVFSRKLSQAGDFNLSSNACIKMNLPATEKQSGP
jgi:hypothetical protein